MRTLAERDVRALLSVVADLAMLDDARPFPPELLRRAGELVGCADVSYRETDRLRQRSIVQASSDGGESDDPFEDEVREYFRLANEHAACSRRARVDDWTSVLKVSGFSSRRNVERTDPRTRVFIFTRTDRDFDERDRLVLELLQPHLQHRYDHARTAAEAADAFATLEEEGTDAFYEVVLCSERGVMEFASPRSRRILATYFGSENGSLPRGLRAALRGTGGVVSVERDGRRLTVRATRSAGMLLLLLGEHDARLDCLTRRQLEILEQVASGATDAEVGSVLGVASTTVKKHLEKIYERLNVHTRTAASAVFLSRRD
jgi:DNA-binding NarL/FixJ family response regulator